MPPRIRADLTIATAEEEGVTYVEVADPLTGISFRFYDFEFALAQQLNGQPISDVIHWAHATYGVELSQAVLDEFVEKLTGLGFLSEAGAGAQPVEVVSASGSSAGEPFQQLPATSTSGTEATLAALFPPGSVETPKDTAGALNRHDEESGDEDAFDAGFRRLFDASSEPAPVALPASSKASESEAAVQQPVSISSGESGRAASPDHLIQGDATEYQLKEPESPSGLFERGRIRTLTPHSKAFTQRSTPPFGSPLTPTRPADGPSAFAKLEALSGPLPPVTVNAKATESNAIAPLVAESSEETPIASIAHAIVSEVLDALKEHEAPTAPEPPRPTLSLIKSPLYIPADERSGADVPPAGDARTTPAPPTRTLTPARPSASGRFPTLGIVGPDDRLPEKLAVTETREIEAQVLSEPMAVAEAPESWASHLSQEVENPRPERRQPPSPDAVVMPPVADASGRLTVPRRSFPTVLAVVLLLAALVGTIWFWWPEIPRPVPSASVPSVHVVSPQPTAFHRWFAAVGSVVPGRDQTLGFPVAGRVQDILPPGTTFAAGETIARLKGVSEREVNVNHVRARVAFLEQLRDSSVAEGNKAAAKDAEAKLALRKRELVAALADLATREIRPTMAGEIAEVLVEAGAVLYAGTPVLKLRAGGPRAAFAFPPEALSRARALTFCRLETIPGAATVDGGAAESTARALDCSLPATADKAGASADAKASAEADAKSGRFVVDLVGAKEIAPGTQVRLASERFESVFPVPHSAVVHQDGAERVWVISGAGRNAEMRAIELASTDPDLALISHGLRTGESVIVDPPASLKSGGEVYVAQ